MLTDQATRDALVNVVTPAIRDRLEPMVGSDAHHAASSVGEANTVGRTPNVEVESASK